MAKPSARAERRWCQTEAHGGVGLTVRTVHSVPRVRVGKVVTRGSVRLPLGSDGWRQTDVQGFLPSLDLTNPR